jgi:type IV secretion system protein VirD4
LDRIYDKGWQSFVSNAGMINYFGSSDQKTAEYFSALCGEQTVWNLSSAVAYAMSSNQGGSGASSGQRLCCTVRRHIKLDIIAA